MSGPHNKRNDLDETVKNISNLLPHDSALRDLLFKAAKKTLGGSRQQTGARQASEDMQTNPSKSFKCEGEETCEANKNGKSSSKDKSDESPPEEQPQSASPVTMTADKQASRALEIGQTFVANSTGSVDSDWRQNLNTGRDKAELANDARLPSDEQQGLSQLIDLRRIQKRAEKQARRTALAMRQLMATGSGQSLTPQQANDAVGSISDTFVFQREVSEKQRPANSVHSNVMPQSMAPGAVGHTSTQEQDFEKLKKHFINPTKRLIKIQNSIQDDMLRVHNEMLDFQNALDTMSEEFTMQDRVLRTLLFQLPQMLRATENRKKHLQHTKRQKEDELEVLTETRM